MVNDANVQQRWSAQKATDWYEHNKWPVGFNYLPSTAVNFVDMWHPDTFDETTVDRELGWAASHGYNSTRVNLQFVLWQSGRDGLIQRIHRYLEISESHGFSTILCLFDDCEFSGSTPSSDLQPDPIPGVHNSRALGSPGRDIVMNKAMWPELEKYVTDIISEFKSDPRVLLWDIYNEPGNASVFTSEFGEQISSEKLIDYSFDLLKSAFGWARQIDPTQPISSAAWRVVHPLLSPDDDTRPFDNPIDQYLLAVSDVVTFHAYMPVDTFSEIIAHLEPLGRPILCTEWMARTAGSYLEQQLPIMHEKKIGAYQWGLVNGRTQTDIPWPAIKSRSKGNSKAESEWFHDVLHNDGSPYSLAEMQLVAKLTAGQITEGAS